MTQTFQMMRVTRMQEMTIRLLLQVKCLIRERLRAVEAESGFLKHAAMTLQRGGEGTKLLTEIAQHLRELRHSDTATAAANA
ncbi:hypothetical protein K7X08_034820 [Anisodus acutangulus]|uniref:Uncharacterized protein n=1 Tax=Anisodus acutangulus TaxID=402998 RepID=A0A9Q1LJZ0_9SOLA|nr:hypothetical protein K7X08_034820 [Anisodus acutangulus]